MPTTKTDVDLPKDQIVGFRVNKQDRADLDILARDSESVSKYLRDLIHKEKRRVGVPPPQERESAL